MLTQYQNGNTLVSLYENGTRYLEYEDTLQLDQPLNVDIRVSNRCSNGYNPKTGKAICPMCHESQTVDGLECDYSLLQQQLESFNPGIELAIGGNEITSGLVDFISWCKTKKFIVNLTVNQIHLPAYGNKLKYLIENDLIKGLGISYRKDYQTKIDPFFIEYSNSVLHCIAGIDTVDDVLASSFNKVLILGYKYHGFGKDYYSSEIELNIRQWQMYLPKLFGKKLVSFDNIAIEQLKVNRFFTKDNWEVFNQGEESFYLNAVDQYFAPSSRTSEGIMKWGKLSAIDYYKQL